jgi:hypothetical protein
VLDGTSRQYETIATAVRILLEAPELEKAWQAVLAGEWFNPLE